MTVFGWQRITGEDIALDDCENELAEVVVVDAADVELATLVDDPVDVVAALVVSITVAVVSNAFSNRPDIRSEPSIIGSRDFWNRCLSAQPQALCNGVRNFLRTGRRLQVNSTRKSSPQEILLPVVMEQVLVFRSGKALAARANRIYGN